MKLCFVYDINSGESFLEVDNIMLIIGGQLEDVIERIKFNFVKEMNYEQKGIMMLMICVFFSFNIQLDINIIIN